MIDIATQLRDALAAAVKSGRTGYAIAKTAGLKPEIVYRFERGDDLRLNTAAKLARALGLSLTATKPKPKKSGRSWKKKFRTIKGESQMGKRPAKPADVVMHGLRTQGDIIELAAAILADVVGDKTVPSKSVRKALSLAEKMQSHSPRDEEWKKLEAELKALFQSPESHPKEPARRKTKK